MSYPVIISELAEQEITEAFIWYEEQKDDLGIAFKDYIIGLVARISRNPLGFQVRYSNVRIAFLYKFPYGIHFKFDANIITIIGVYHTSRDSNIWFTAK